MANAGFSYHSTPDAEATRFARGGDRSAVLTSGRLLSNTYVIEQHLARGGMGDVYRARHVELGSEHAIKVMLPELAEDPKIVQLFREEARKLARINNDAIVDYEGFFRDEQGLRYLVTEFVRGESLAAVLQGRRLEPEEVVRLRDRLALGLAAAHEVGIVHRDVSPENILLPEGKIDRAKLIDFGIAKSTDPGATTIIGGEFAGKYSYASPEQLGLFGGRVDLRSDIYSLGLVLAAAAIGFGKKLDMGSSTAEMIAARQKAPDLAEVPASLRPIIAPMLQPRPDDRPPSMRALLEHDDALAIHKARLAPAFRPARSGPRRAALLFAAGVGLAAAGIGSVAVLHMMTPAPSIDALRARLAAATTGYRCASLAYAVDPSGSVRVSGYAASRQDIDRLHQAADGIGGVRKLDFSVSLRIWPFCEVTRILQPLIDQKPPVAAALSLSPGDSAVHVGDPLVIDVHTPRFDGYVYLDYFDGEGEVAHLFPNELDKLNFRPALNHLALGKPPFEGRWNLAGTPGEQLVSLVATAEPLFSIGRPAVEKAKDYLPDLARAIGNIPGDDKAAAVLFFQLRGASP
jgi:hypothetical protein